MTYDYTTGTMYCVAGASESEMNLYAANIKTGAITLLMQTEQNFMSIAAARDGMLYAIENSQYAVTDHLCGRYRYAVRYDRFHGL